MNSLGKIKIEQGSTFYVYASFSYIVNYPRKAHVKITRQWKFSLTVNKIVCCYDDLHR